MQETLPPGVKEKPHRFPCPSCGAELVFAPQHGALVCPYCGRMEEIPASAEQVQERSYEEYLRPRASQLHTIAADALEVSCNSCGATVTFTPPEVAGECSFCGTPLVAQPKSADPMVAPEGVLPFSVPQDQARESIKQWLASRWFAPNALKKFATQESIGGVYIPFWTYDAHTTSHYRGERGEHYYDTEYYTEMDAQGNAVRKSRQVVRTRWYPASGTVSRWFDDILIPATTSVPRNRLAALEPWDLDAIRAYEPAYLSGFKAQRYQVDMATGFEEAKQLMAGVIEGDVRRDIGGDEQRVHQIATSYSAITFKHILMPVYIGAYRFNQKVYQVIVNARTGEVQGDRPYSFWKIFFFVLLLLVIVGLIAFLSGGEG
ncbi:MAG TPA: TFIIB-type zinc ribbon-containing protein [Blastocatellia bacterium]|nr:TFIIB-type zinc ribbon-containing protein [Blastocatellia bacterium]